MRSRPIRRAHRGFTLLEVLVVLVILAIAASGLAIPLAAQLQLRKAEATRRILEEAKETLLGFAAAHGRLPCPAQEASRGEESFAAGGDSTNGACSSFHDGYLPAAALGLSPVDADGFLRDAWDSPRNRVRYAVFGNGLAVNGIVNPLTRTNGMQSATLAGLGAAPHFLFICASGLGASASGCGPASNQLTRRAAFVLLSLGPDAPASPPAGSDAARNLDGDAVFVSHEASNAPGNEFDDLVTWTPVHLVASRLISAGRLP
jgi:prepilin-type N-terminal cleavage/methylation domain-containing protein